MSLYFDYMYKMSVSDLQGYLGGDIYEIGRAHV